MRVVTRVSVVLVAAVALVGLLVSVAWAPETAGLTLAQASAGRVKAADAA